MAPILTSTAIFLSTLFLTFVTSKPLPNTSPKLDVLEVRTPAPVTATAFTDWATNVIFLGGAQQFGMWIPPDGTWYDLGKIQCLDLPAYAVGNCNWVTVDQIGVAVGNGPCSFIGANGWKATIPGVAGEGYYTVGPPQTILYASCGPVS